MDYIGLAMFIPIKSFGPSEKPTWTAGAVLLAADTLYGFTPGHELFLQDWTSLN